MIICIFLSNFQAIDPTPWVDACKRDFCECDAGESCGCNSAESYFRECLVAGVEVKAWRDVAQCRVSCDDDNSGFQTCGTMCPATCETRAVKMCSDPTCIDGCFCEKGYVLEDGECIKSEVGMHAYHNAYIRTHICTYVQNRRCGRHIQSRTTTSFCHTHTYITR